MTVHVPTYPRIAHLIAGRGTRDDLVLGPSECASLVEDEVTLEEKLDGANVSIWVEDHRVQCATRSGPGGMDRAGQLGPLRAWAAERSDRIVQLLEVGEVLYGEWLLLTHRVSYDQLPDSLIVLDLYRDATFLPTEERNRRCAEAGLSVPPLVWSGRPGSVAGVERHLGPSKVGSGSAEGLIIRRNGPGEPRIAKLVREGFAPISDDDWRRERPRNRIGGAPGQASVAE